ncbi:MAG: ISL3 family transposase [Candidatus Sulfotelmatobacter sp.]|jgi:transposase
MSRSLSPCPAEVQVERLFAEADHITLVVRVFRPVVPCPGCTRLSCRIHSYYERRVADLPWNGIPVKIRLRTRRFFCDTENCAQRIFTERLPETAETYARRTVRMEQALRWLALALGGAAGSRTAQRLGLGVSGDTLLRHLRRMPLARKPAPIAPRVLGMDDWAWRKGQRYGTILCDLERRCVIDLLPDRQANTVAEWLRDHAPPEVISRDRAGAYAEAARQGAPHAVQVADRFHLLRNLREALERVLARHGSVIEEAFRRHTPAAVTDPPPTPSNPALTHSQQLSRERRERRLTRYQQVIELHQRGTSLSAIAFQLGLNRKTVRDWLCAGQFPERQLTPRRSSVDRWLSYLENGGSKVATIAANSGGNCGPRERILPRSRCAAGSASGWGYEGILTRFHSLRPGNAPVRGKPVPSCSTLSTIHLHHNKASHKLSAPFLLTLPRPWNWPNSSIA